MAWPYNKDGIRPTIIRKTWLCGSCGVMLRRDSMVIKTKTEYFCAECVPLEKYFKRTEVD